MARVIWSPEALGTLDRITSHIAQDDADAAKRYASRLIEAGNSLADFPMRGRRAKGGVRELVTVRPYVIRYETTGNVVDILGIRHMAQDAS